MACASSKARSRSSRRKASESCSRGASTGRCATFSRKRAEGPVLIVAERIDAIGEELARRGWADQFHPSYTRMVPAHHVTTLRLIGCPDPNPIHHRFFDPPREMLPPDLDVIGTHYIEALYSELRRWLAVHESATNPLASSSRAESIAAPCCSVSTSCC